MLPIKILHRAALAVTILFFLGFSGTRAATLQLNANVSTLAVGDSATLSVIVNSGGVTVNNAEATIKFPTDLFDVVSISKKDSVFSLWIEDPSFSNSAGTITFDGGIPTPGFSGAQGIVLSIMVKAKKAGAAGFVFADAAVRADDGLGTDVLTASQGRTLTVTEKKAAPPAAQSASSPGLQISSLTHPDQNQWYKNNSPEFQWVVPSGADAVQVGISNNASDAPFVVYSPAISQKNITDLEDGIWYFKVRARKGGSWGSVSAYTVRIDTVAPSKGDVAFIYDNDAKVLAIVADIKDTTSGMGHYEIYINGAFVKSVSADEFVDGKYRLGIDASGSATARLLAFDRAGNSVEVTGSFEAVAAVPRLEPIPPAISYDEQILIRGTTPAPSTDVAVKVRHDADEPVVLITKSGADGSYFVLTPKLKPGRYDIWAETGIGRNMVSSAHLSTQATSPSQTATVLLAVLVLAALGVLLLGSFSFGSRYGRMMAKKEEEIKESAENDLSGIDKNADPSL